MSTPAEREIEQALVDDATGLCLVDAGLHEIPASLASLTQLVRLDLSHNQITEIPAWLAELPALTELELNYNHLRTVPVGLANLGGLTGLGLAGNRLATLPDWLDRLCGLRWLSLSANAFTELPRALARLSGLAQLDVGYNGLASLPDWIGLLTGLTALDASANALRRVPAALADLIRLARLSLRGNQLEDLPADLVRLHNITRLSLSENQFAEVPAVVRALTSLADLTLRGNRLTILPDWLGDLENLTVLSVSANRLGAVPPALGRLTRLTELGLEDNQLTSLPPELGELPAARLDVGGNPLPPELQAANEEGPAELMAFLRLLRAEGKLIHEAKLVLVGEAQVGKSSLLAALRGEPWRANRPLTHGIEVKPLDVRHGDVQIRLNGWDFSGQPAYRATHQLFFSAPAVYLVLWNPRVGPERNFVDYWINLIRHRAGDSARILVVATHAGPGQRSAFLDEDELKARYGGLVGEFHQVDSETGYNLDSLRASIAATAAGLPHIGRYYPRSWQRLRTTLAGRGEPYLSYAEYERLALEHGLSETSARSLVGNATALGHWICYSDQDGLADLVIMQPDWLSTAIGYVIDDPATYQARGLLPHRRLRTLWQDPQHNVRYEPRVHSAFLHLMERFDLSYRVAGEEPMSLVAQLVPATKPDLRAFTEYRPEWPEHSQVCVVVEADTGIPGVPEALMCQLIVRFHRYSLGRLDHRASVHWQRGMILDDTYNGRALVELDRNRVRVRVRAPYPRSLLHQLTREIRDQVESFWLGFRVCVMVPCDRCGDRSEPGLFDVAMLIEIRDEDDVIRCSTCGARQAIDDLLADVRRWPKGRLPAGDPAATRRVEDAATALAARGSLRANEVGSYDAGTVAFMSQLHDEFCTLRAALDDIAREGPWLFTVDPVNRSVLHPGLTHCLVRVRLWCEHAKVPLHLLHGDETGVYELSIPREWLIKAAPVLKPLLTVLRGVAAIVQPGLENVVPEVARGELVRHLLTAERSFAALPGVDINGNAVTASRLPEYDEAMLRLLHDFLRKADPSFGGLQRVPYRSNRHSYRWVDPRFASLYVPQAPRIPPAAD